MLPHNKLFSTICIVMLILFSKVLPAQELQAKVVVLTQQLPNSVNKKIFTTLQNQLTNLLNNRAWTKDTYNPTERIECNFLLNVEQMTEENIFSATLTVQAARPVYNSSYKSALINFQDNNVTFKYIEYQPIEFNENRVAGTDALAANLTAIFAYYAYIILGMDYDSFSPKGGIEYFRKAQNIVNNAPEARNISGWKNFDGLRNRYWLAENINNNRYNMLHDVVYNYYRKGLDSMYTSPNEARENVLDALSKLQTLNQQFPGLMFVQFFMQERYQELSGIFKTASPSVQARALELLSTLDIANSNKYRNDWKQ